MSPVSIERGLFIFEKSSPELLFIRGSRYSPKLKPQHKMAYDYESYVKKPRINQPPYLIDIRQRQPARRKQRHRIESTE
jgi:hypothetical protein